MLGIIAHKMNVILRDADMVKFTHVTSFKTTRNKIEIIGETLDEHKMAQSVTRTYKTTDILVIYIEFAPEYEP